MTTTISIPTLNELSHAADIFLTVTGGRGVYAFYGDLGSGKTTFIKAVCEQMGVTDTINSPTFAIINEYSLPDGEPLYHIDLYRLKDESELINLGCEEYFESGHPCFIEWPEKAESWLPEQTVRVSISIEADGSRKVTIRL